MNQRLVSISAAIAGLLAGVPAAAGGIFITGHDSDWHAAYNGGLSALVGPQHIVQTSINYVTGAKVNPHILYVTDDLGVGLDSLPSQAGLTLSGFTNFDLADDGTNHIDVGTVNFANYDAIVVASSGGGQLHQSELDKLNARAADFVTYINAGGGLVAFAESTQYPGGTTHNLYGFLPFVVVANSLPQDESTFMVTPFGAGLGLLNSDVQAGFAHNTFSNDAGMQVVDRDGAGAIISLAFTGTIGLTGVVAEPGVFSLIGLGLVGAALSRRKRA